jgi:hypothetical protein
MLSNFPPPVLLDVAILFTALAWCLGFYLTVRRFYVFASLATGCFVCLIGYTVASLGAPVWAIIAAPVPVDIYVLWYVLRSLRKSLIAYPAIWAIYVLLHAVLSSVFHYDSLIPGWRLHS